MKLHFLGTGGGRYVTGLQQRKTAGIVVKTQEAQLHVDPGPGALVYSRKELDEPGATNAVLVSHAHLDHCNDAQALIEMASEAESMPVHLFANDTVLHGRSNIEKTVSDYHRELCSSVNELEDGFSSGFKDLEIESQEMFHSDPRTQGFKLEDDEHCIGFWTDTEFSSELTEFYTDCDVLVVYCTRPKGRSLASHTSLDQVPDIVEAAGPNTVIVTHFGKAFLDADMEEQEQWLKDELDCKVVFADDGMKFPGNRSLGDF